MLAVVGLRTALQRQVPGQFLKTELQKALGHPLRFESFELSWDARLVLHKLELLDQQKVFLTVSEARLDFDRNLALQGKLQVLKLTLQQPTLELSQSRWQRFSQKTSASPARPFPVLLRSLNFRWLDDQAQLAWELSNWHGSLPPVAADHWHVALQAADGASLEAEGKGEQVEMKLVRFPVSQLATLATGAEPGTFEAGAVVDLSARRSSKSGWQIDAQLNAQVFRGPISLQLETPLKGLISSPGGELDKLGAIKDVQLPFVQQGDKWLLGPGRLGWRGSQWTLQAWVGGEDTFEGQLKTPSLQLAQGLPVTQLHLVVKGSARKRLATFVADAQFKGFHLKASGQASEAGIPEAVLRIQKATRDLATARLAWNSASGAIKANLLPVQIQSLVPGWKGQLQGQVERTAAGLWRARASCPKLQGKPGSLAQLQLELAGQPALWKGKAVWTPSGQKHGTPISLSGPLEKPEVKFSQAFSAFKGKANLALQGDGPKRLAHLRLLSHDLSYRGKPLPKVQGSLELSLQGIRSDKLALSWGQNKVPIEASGEWARWQLKSTLKDLPLSSLRNWLAYPFDGQLSGAILLGPKERTAKLKLEKSRWNKQELGSWSLVAKEVQGQPPTLLAENLALQVAPLNKMAVKLHYQKGYLVLSTPKLGWKQLGLGPSKLRLHLGKTVWKIDQGQLGTVPPSPFSGQLDPKTRALALKGQLNNLSIVGLPGLPPLTQGKLSGSWQMAGQALSLTGKVAQLKVLGQSFGDVPVQAKAQPKDINLQLGPVDVKGVTALQKLGSLAGQLQLAFHQSGDKVPEVSGQLRQAQALGKPLADLDFQGVVKDSKLENFRLNWALKPPLVVQGQLGLTSSLKASLTGQSLQALCLGLFPVEGTAQGQLSYETLAGWVGTTELKNLRAAGQSLGSGRLNFRYKERLKLTGEEFSAAHLDLLQQRYPGLQGRLSFDLDSDLKAHSGSLKLRAAQWHQAPFPDVTAVGESQSQGSGWLISSLQLAMQPPLQARGRMWPEQSRVQLNGQLDGQSLADLTRLGGGAAPPDVTTRLFGPFQLAAQGQQLNLSFQGQARQLTYRGVALGDGELKFQANPGLDGQLILQQPMELNQVAGIPAGLQAVLPVQGLFSALRLRGVQLKGTLQQPNVSPLWATPKIKFQLR